MTQTQRYTFTQWAKIITLWIGIAAFMIQTGTIIKKGAEWYAGIVVVMGNQKNIDDAQNNLLNRDNQIISFHDSLLNDHERRLSHTELDVEMIKRGIK